MRRIRRHAIVDDAPLLLHQFHLRPDLEVTIDLPEDLASNEAYRIGQMVQWLVHAEDSVRDELLTHHVPIRENLIINLELPLNLSSTEAMRFSDFIECLPFDI